MAKIFMTANIAGVVVVVKGETAGRIDRVVDPTAAPTVPTATYKFLGARTEFFERSRFTEQSFASMDEEKTGAEKEERINA